MAGAARIGDALDHGGSITSGSSDTLTNGIPTARVGDTAVCAVHGPTTIVSGSPNVLTNGIPTARITDVTGCGASIVSGSPDRDIGDSPVTGSVESFEGFQPWAATNDVAAQVGEDASGPPTARQLEVFKRAKIDPQQTNPDPPVADSTPPPPKVDTPQDCGDDIHGKTSFPTNFPLSPNFVLAHLSTSCLLEHSAVQAQAGLTIDQVVCNLRMLCLKIIEPLTAQYGRPSINCGFRSANAPYGASNSLHKYGRAADLQWAGISDEEYYNRATWVRDNLPFCEVILEFGGNRPWLHVAYDKNSNARKCLTRVTVASGYVQGIVQCRNVPRVGGTRV